MARKKLGWEPKVEDFRQVFDFQNPWHEQGVAVPAEDAPAVERALAKALWRRVVEDDPHRFQVILGARRVGKTTCMHQTIAHLLENGVARSRLWFLRLDNPLLSRFPLGEWVRAIVNQDQKEPLYLFLDELTYAADWPQWLKTFFDERWPVRIVASSSSTAALRAEHPESGVGRWEEQYLPPCLLSEYLDLIGQHVDVPVEEHLDDTVHAVIAGRSEFRDVSKERGVFMMTGGFPELLLHLGDAADVTGAKYMKAQRLLAEQAVDGAIFKDIPQAVQIENPADLRRLLYVLAGQVAQLFSPTSIGKDLGLSQPTLDKYLSHLERAFLVFTVPNYSASERNVQKRGKKVYFVDGAVRNAALQRGLRPWSDAAEQGVLLENLVASHLHALCNQTNVRLYHWRDGNQREVDLVYADLERPMAFEIARGQHSRRGLTAFLEAHPGFKGRSYVVSTDTFTMDARAASDGIGSLPMDLLLLAIGAQAERRLVGRLGG